MMRHLLIAGSSCSLYRNTSEMSREIFAGPSRKVARDLPNQIEFLRLQLPAAERQTTTDGHWHDASPADCRFLMLTLHKYLGNVQRNLCRSVARLRPRHFMAQRANLQRGSSRTRCANQADVDVGRRTC